LSRIILIVVLIFFGNRKSLSQDTIYLNRDTSSIESVVFAKAAFNTSTNFNQNNLILNVPLNTSQELTIYNNDTIPHLIAFPDGSPDEWINPGTYFTKVIGGLNFGTYSIFSKTPQGELLGLGAIYRVAINGLNFTWDLWEQDPLLTFQIAEGSANNIPVYYRPSLFAINGGVDPMDLTSSAALIGSVGDTILLSIVNNGNMVHPIHFHGYHVEILQSTIQSDRVGLKKDSFPVYVNEGMTVRLIPDKPGDYPVHNHNLVSTLFNNNYPKGMITMISIAP
jgi:hypothetical protein